MLNDLFRGNRMASVGETLKLFFLDLSSKPPLFRKSPLPLSANGAALRVVVVTIVAELLLVV
jgi:hypothetical protein